MPAYTTPGVYFERVDETPAVAALRTDIVAFVGLAERGPLDRPTRLTSWQQFSAAFGGLSRRAFLAYAVNAFFENGGAVCWVVRVAGFDAAAAGIDVVDGTGTPILRVDASTPGTWALGLEARIVRSSPAAAAATVGAVGEDGLRVDTVAGFAEGAWVQLMQPGVPPSMRTVAGADAVLGLLTLDAPLDPALDPGRPISVETVEFAIRAYEHGILVEDHPAVPLLPPSPGSKPVPVEGPLLTISRHALAPPLPGAYHDPVVADLGFGGGRRSALLAGGRDGLAALTRDDFVAGLAALEPVDEISLVAIPDILVRPLPPVDTDPLPPPEVDPCLPCGALPPPPPMPPASGEQPPLFPASDVYAVQRALVEHCERLHDRVALLDPPFDADVGEVQSWRARFDSKYAALYYPWVLVYDADSPALVRALPPSGHVAGVCARVDLGVGVWVAPANQELDWAVGVGLELDTERHGLLNALGVNCIRPIAGRGIRILGARTVSSDPSWRFLNVRRLMCMIEEAVDQSIQWTTFEPNTPALQDALAISIRSFLEQLWGRGALVGATEDDAFFVRCDDDTNPQAQTADGLLLAVVGVAPVRPAEFVVFRIGRAHDELEVIE